MFRFLIQSYLLKGFPSAFNSGLYRTISHLYVDSLTYFYQMVCALYLPEQRTSTIMVIWLSLRSLFSRFRGGEPEVVCVSAKRWRAGDQEQLDLIPSGTRDKQQSREGEVKCHVFIVNWFYSYWSESWPRCNCLLAYWPAYDQAARSPYCVL